jgi:two-component system, sensor histidine kinase and response regulator
MRITKAVCLRFPKAAETTSMTPFGRMPQPPLLRRITVALAVAVDILRNRHKNGEPFREETSISPVFDETGKTPHFLGVKEDIDQRKPAENALRHSNDAYVSILATLQDGFWLTDSTGRLLDVNETYVRQSGYSLEELLSMRIHDLVASSPALVDARMAGITRQGSEQFESVHRRKNGSLWHVEVSASYRAAGAGQFFVFLRDITSRKAIQQQLEEQHEQIEIQVRERTADLVKALEAATTAQRAKDALLANVSHELRAPLNAVLGLAVLAQKASSDPKQRETLQKINDAGQTLLEIVNDLLDLTKIAAGQMRFEVSPFDPRELLARASDVLTYRAAEKGLYIDESVAANVPSVLLGDPLRVEQILLNLLRNAIKFTERGRIMVRITSEPPLGERVRLRIEVEDSGIGLSQEEAARLFEPFAQADASVPRKHGGTGLAICKQLATAMGGEITVASRLGQGSTFRVDLWLRLGGRPDVPVATSAPDESSDPRFPGARILVVDDQPLNREVVAELLRTVGASPQQATDGRQALQALRNAGPDGFDLVLMDIQMPIMDGLAATQQVRSLPGFAELPIVAMTAHAMEHDKASYLKAGMSDYLGKPFNIDRFYAMLRKWLPRQIVAAGTAGGTIQPSSSAASPAVAAASPLSVIEGLDASGALPRFNGDLERYCRWLRVFVNESEGFAQQVGALLAAAQPDEACELVHAFKGRVGMLGMTQLHALASELESSIGEAAALEGMLMRLENQVVAMCTALRAAIGPDKITT